MSEFVLDMTLKGHPIPYLRMTRGELRAIKYAGKGATKYHVIKRYLEWKDYVLLTFTSCCHQNGIQLLDMKQKSYMEIRIWFENKRHGDPDNIWKGIADAIYDNDKFVEGKFIFEYDKDNPRVEVFIYGKTMDDGEIS